MAPFLDLSRLSFEIWKAPCHLLDVHLALFFGPLAHAPSDVVLDQGNHCGRIPKWSSLNAPGSEIPWCHSLLGFIRKISFFRIGGETRHTHHPRARLSMPLSLSFCAPLLSWLKSFVSCTRARLVGYLKMRNCELTFRGLFVVTWRLQPPFAARSCAGERFSLIGTSRNCYRLRDNAWCIKWWWPARARQASEGFKDCPQKPLRRRP